MRKVFGVTQEPSPKALAAGGECQSPGIVLRCISNLIWCQELVTIQPFWIFNPVLIRLSYLGKMVAGAGNAPAYPGL